MSVLKKVKVRWASVIKPDTRFDPCWKIDVELSKEQAEALKAEAKAVHKKGIKIKVEEDGVLTFRFKRRVSKADGGENNPPVIIDTHGKQFNRLIGNGSVCDVQYSFVKYNNNKFGEGVTNDLKGVMVRELVAYGVQDGEEFEVDSESDDEESEFETEKNPSKSSSEFDDDDFE